jgi:DNA-directed RNA polymerase specialized sigma24 family protein
MSESAFDRGFLNSCRIASARAAKIARAHRLTSSDFQDLQQEGIFSLWRSAHKFEARQASWRTFAEAVIGNRLTSCMRHMCAERRGQSRNKPLEASAFGLRAPDGHFDLRVDVQRILAGVSAFDRAVAQSLMYRSASETGRYLRASRATIYRSIRRLRLAFASAGFTARRAARAELQIALHEVRNQNKAANNHGHN